MDGKDTALSAPDCVGSPVFYFLGPASRFLRLDGKDEFCKTGLMEASMETPRVRRVVPHAATFHAEQTARSGRNGHE